MASKMDCLRERVLEIAELRRCGYRWGKIAEHLSATGIPVGESEIRASWPRLSRGQDVHGLISRHADQVLETALASLIACAVLQERVNRLEKELVEARARIFELQSDLAAVDLMALGVGRRR